VADDEKALRRVLRDRLITAGYEVMEAADGQECLELLTSETIDLVILDIAMPVMDGIEVAREIKKLPHIPKVIVLTNSSDLNSISEMLSVELFTYLIKADNSLESILETVKEKLSQP